MERVADTLNYGSDLIGQAWLHAKGDSGVCTLSRDASFMMAERKRTQSTGAGNITSYGLREIG